MNGPKKCGKRGVSLGYLVAEYDLVDDRDIFAKRGDTLPVSCRIKFDVPQACLECAENGVTVLRVVRSGRTKHEVLVQDCTFCGRSYFILVRGASTEKATPPGHSSGGQK